MVDTATSTNVNQVNVPQTETTPDGCDASASRPESSTCGTAPPAIWIWAGGRTNILFATDGDNLAKSNLNVTFKDGCSFYVGASSTQTFDELNEISILKDTPKRHPLLKTRSTSLQRMGVKQQDSRDQKVHLEKTAKNIATMRAVINPWRGLILNTNDANKIKPTHLEMKQMSLPVNPHQPTAKQKWTLSRQLTQHAAAS